MTITIDTTRLVICILAGIVWLTGCFILCRNSDGGFKHNVLMGLIGGIFVVVVPILFFGGTCEGWW